MALFGKKQENQARVVICDDQAEVRALYKRLLEKAGRFDLVAEGTDGEEAIALVTEHRPDALLLDFAMPGMNGVEALKKVREASPGTKIVVVTSFFSMAEEAIAMGADAFVSKSAQPKDILAALDGVLTDRPEENAG